MGKFVNKKIGNVTGKTGGFIEKTIINDGFVSDLRKIKPITAEQERELFIAIDESKKRVEAAKGQDNYIQVKTIEDKIQLDLRNEIIARNQYLNYAIAKRYNNTDNVMDLVNVGAIGMIEAFDKYDYTQNVRFCTYATYYIRRAINAYLNKENLMIRTTNDSKLISKVKNIENIFFAKEGRYPTTAEIKYILAKDYNINNIDELDLSMADITSIDANISSDDDFAVRDSLAYNSKTASYNEIIDNEEVEDNKNIINNLLKLLSERERIIITMSTGYGYDREYKDYEIAEIVNLTSERVRQLRIKTLHKLQKLVVTR